MNEYGGTVSILLEVMKQLARTIRAINQKGVLNNFVHENNVCVKIIGKNAIRVTLVEFTYATDLKTPLLHRCATTDERIRLNWLAPEIRKGKPGTETSDVFSYARMFHRIFKLNI